MRIIFILLERCKFHIKNTFLFYSEPTPEITNESPVKWDPSTKDNLRFLYLNRQLEMGGIPSSPQVYNMWKNIYTKYRMTRIEDIANVFRINYETLP